MYTLFWHPWSSSYAPMAVLEELGVDFDLYAVDYDGGETETHKYRRLQPLGLIPALKIDEQRSMFESAAIIIFLCDCHTDAGLAPLPHSPERPQYLQWMFYLADTIYPSYNRYFHPERYTVSEDGSSSVKEQSAKTLITQWQVVENALREKGPWLLGDYFSACDVYLQMMTTWHESPQDLFRKFPLVGRLSKNVCAREPCRRAASRHNFNTSFEM